MTYTQKILLAVLAALVVAIVLVAGPLRSTVNGDAHKLEPCLSGAVPAAGHG